MKKATTNIRFAVLLMLQGFRECFRVLRPNGTLVFKWSEVQIPLSEWVMFMKEEEQA